MDMAKPKIRFKGYQDDWEQRKLEDILFSLQNNTLSRADLSNETGVAKNVHYGDILTKFGEVLDISKEQLPMIMDEGVLTKYKTSFLQNGDVIITDTAEDTTVGKCSEIAGLNDEVVLSGLHTIPYRPIKKFASGYLGYYLNSSAYHNQLIPLMQGIKVTSISKAAMQDTDIVYPKPMEEQAMIGNYFQSLDHLITLHQRKCDEAKKLKKFMLQKMFPQNGSLVPEIRFDGFTDDWEQRKLGEIATETYGGGTPKTSNEEFWKGDIPWIQSSDLIDECLFDVRPRKCISQEAVSKSATKLVPQNSIAIVTRVGVGKLAFMPFSYATSQDFLSLSGLKIDPEFTVYALYKMTQSVSNEVQGTSIKGVTKDELLAKKIIFPSCNEQKKIGAYLHNLDHLITLHQQKCDDLKNLKKYMLQNMFI